MTSWDASTRWYLDQVTAPTGIAVNLHYLKSQHLRLTSSATENDRITRAIHAATLQCEYFTGRAILPQTWALILDRFPARIEIPKPPLMSVTSIQYVDEDGATQTLAGSVYSVKRQYSERCRRSVIDLAYNQSWPTTRAPQRDAVTVTFRAGYVEDPDGSPEVVDVPADLKDGIAMRAAELYKQRSDSVIGFGITVAPAVVASRNLWDAYRVF